MSSARLRRCLAVSGLSLSLTACGASQHPEPAAAAPARVVGTVLAGPTCPVEHAGSPCPDTPVSGATVRLVGDGKVLARALTDAHGTFTLAAPPGSYVVKVTNVGGYRSNSSEPVELTATAPATVTLHLDTGIR
ncbi:MAG: carboxypeptidase-like regulatory domain-containing protein [Nocardioidaceae bacterium]